MASKTKPTEADATFALENPATLTGETLPPEADNATLDLSGPDAPEAPDQTGVADAPEADPVVESADADAPEDDPIVSTIEVGPQQAANLLADLSPEARTIHLDYFADFLKAMTPEDRAYVWAAAHAGDAVDPDPATEGALTPTGFADLARLLDEVGARTAGLTGGNVGPGLRRFLEAEGAEISEDDPATVTLGGITASSQFGLNRALLDWCMIASRKIMAGAA